MNRVIGRRPRFCEAGPLFVIAFGIVSSPAWAGGQPPQRQTAVMSFVPLRDNGTPVVESKINDSYDAEFLIDTGGSDCILTQSAAKALGLKTQPAYLEGELPLTFGVGGQSEFGIVSKLLLGNLMIDKMPFIVIPDSSLFKYPEHKIDGIIGGTLFGSMALFIDYPRRTLALITPGKLTANERAGLRMSGAHSIRLKQQILEIAGPTVAMPDFPEAQYSVDISAKAGGVVASDELVVDTGAPATSLGYQAAQRLHLTPYDRQSSVTLFEGGLFTNVERVPEVDISDLTLTNLQMDCADIKDTRVPPLLGEDVLSCASVLFDFPDHRMYINPVLPPIATNAAILDISQIDRDRLRGDCILYNYPSVDMAGVESVDRSDPDSLIQLEQTKIDGTDADAEVFKTIGDTYWDDDRTEDAIAAYRKEAVARQKTATAKPDDPQAQADLAGALMRSQDLIQADAVARAATAKFSKSAPVWIALGRVLHAQSLLAVTGRPYTVSTEDDYSKMQALVNRLSANPPSSKDISTAQSEADDARRCFDTAVQLAPNDAQPYLARAAFISNDGYGRVYILALAQNRDDRISDYSHQDPYCSDRDAAAQYRPDDVDLQRNAAFDDVHHAIMKHGKDVNQREGFLWKTLPPIEKRAAQDKIDRLKAIASGKDDAKSADAYAALALIDIGIKQDKTAAETDYKSGLDKDATNGPALIGLTSLMSDQRRYADLLDYQKGLAAKKDSALLQVLMARTYMVEQN